MITYAIENQPRWTPIAYTLDELAARVGQAYRICPYDTMGDNTMDALVSYGRRPPSVTNTRGIPWIHIYESPYWKESSGKLPELPDAPTILFGETPVLYRGVPSGEAASDDGPADQPSVFVEADIISSAFFFLSRWEEVKSSVVDAHGRFPASEAYAVRYELMDRPVVDEYALTLREYIGHGPLGRAPVSPWRAGYAFCASHDIDCISLFGTLKSTASALKRSCRRNWRAAIPVIVDASRCVIGRRPDPADNLRQVSAVDCAQGALGSFFLFGGGATRYDSPYVLDSMREAVHELASQGHEIGLHGSYSSMCRAGRLEMEWGALSRIADLPVASVRQHYLRLRVPDTWRAMAEAGLETDSSLGYAQREGFRAGTCYPFQTYDALADQRLNLWEVPLIAMDATLYGYRGLSPHQTLVELERLLRTVRHVGGVFTVLWHNTTFYEPLQPNGASTFRRLLDIAAKDDAKRCTISTVSRAWKAHQEELRCGSS